MKEFKVENNHVFFAFIHDKKAYVQTFKFNNPKKEKESILKFIRLMEKSLDKLLENIK